MLPNCYQGYPTAVSMNGYNGFTPNVTSVPMSQMQAVQPAYTLIGRVVNKQEDIIPNDVPMDGSYGIFPLQDRSKIFLKRWNSDGTITTEQYVKEVAEDIPAEPIKESVDEKLTTIQFDIDQLKSAFDRIEKAFKAKPATMKKEA